MKVVVISTSLRAGSNSHAVAGEARLPAREGPASVAVHDDGEMAGNAVHSFVPFCASRRVRTSSVVAFCPKFGSVLRSS